MEEIQAVRTTAEIRKHGIAKHCITHERLRVNRSSDNCTRCNPNQQESALEERVISTNATGFSNKHHIVKCPHHVREPYDACNSKG